MKCYFTFNNDVENNTVYTDMLECALKTARENTTLDLYCLYDGSADDKLYSLLKKYNVKVHFCKLSFYDLLDNFYDDEEYNKAYGFSKKQLKQAACNFMKFEIPTFEKEDEVVLYSDMDVIFLRDLEYKNLYTKTLAAAPEFEQDYDRIKGNRYFNAGVMLLNVKELANRKQVLINMLKNKQRPYQECWDQGFFNEIYKDDFDELPIEYNWKPYWGIGKNPYIVHLHGFKPFCYSKNAIDVCSTLLHRYKASYEGWLYYFAYFCRVLNKNEFKCIVNTSKFLSFSKDVYPKRWLMSSGIMYNLHKFLIKSKCKKIFIPLIKYFDKKLKKRGIVTIDRIQEVIDGFNEQQKEDGIEL